MKAPQSVGGMKAPHQGTRAYSLDGAQPQKLGTPIPPVVGQNSIRLDHGRGRLSGRRVAATSRAVPASSACGRPWHHGLVTELVRAGWLRYVRKHNASLLGDARDLSSFLFGSERGDLS